MPQKRDKNSEFAITLRERLIELRTMKFNLTQAEFAKRVGISTSSVGLYETGERIPDAETLYKISIHCSVSVDYLLGRSEVKEINPEKDMYQYVTGLSETAIDELTHYDKTSLDAINLLLESYPEFELSEIYENIERNEKNHILLEKWLKTHVPILPAIRDYLLCDIKSDTDYFVCYNGKVKTKEELEKTNSSASPLDEIVPFKVVNQAKIIEEMLISEIVENLKQYKRILNQSDN